MTKNIQKCKIFFPTQVSIFIIRCSQRSIYSLCIFVFLKSNEAQLLTTIQCFLLYFQFLFNLMKRMLPYGIFLLLAFTVLSLPAAFSMQEVNSYQAGLTELYLQTKSQSDDQHQTDSQVFELTFGRPITYPASAVVAIAGFQESFGDINPVILSIKRLRLTDEHLKLMVEKKGKIASVQLSYLVFDKTFQNEYGVWTWMNEQKRNKVTFETQEPIFQIRLTRNRSGQFRGQTQIEELVGLNRQITSGKQVKVVPFLSSLIIAEKTAIRILQVHFNTKTHTIQVELTSFEIFEMTNLQPTFTLMVSSQHEHQKVPSLQSLQLSQSELQRFTGSKLGKLNQKLLIFGLTAFHSSASFKKLHLSSKMQENWLNATMQGEGSFSQTIISFSSLMLTTLSSAPRLLPAVSCVIGTYHSYYNWTHNALTSYPFYKCQSCPPKVCQPCPIGCASCSDYNFQEDDDEDEDDDDDDDDDQDDGCSQRVTCGSCDTSKGFSLAKASCDDDQSSQKRCACATNFFPNINTKGCDSCANVIPNCAQCKQAKYEGVYCQTCSSGFYKVRLNITYWTSSGNTTYYISYKKNKYVRSCAACLPGCNVCQAPTACTTCSKNLILSGGKCTCDTTKGLYYNTATKNCTACSAAIPGCTTCALTGTTTTCTACPTGSYINPATSASCLPCPTHCTNCTAMACFQCVSNTFTKTGTSCLCTSPLFLIPATATTPAFCQACSKFPGNCLTCTNSTGSVLCQTCPGGFYLFGGTCNACPLYCTSCTSTTCLSFIGPYFKYDPSVDPSKCVCITDYVLKNSACVSCGQLIPNCQKCNPDGVNCDICNDPFYLDTVSSPHLCKACPITCTSCINATYCDGCANPAYSYVTVGLTQSCGCTNCDTCQLNTVTNVIGCASCTSPTSPSTCLYCAAGTYPVGQINVNVTACPACPIACATCTSSTSCLSCQNNFIFVSPDCVCNTAIGEFFDSSYVKGGPGPTEPCRSCNLIYPNCNNCTSTLSGPSDSKTICNACDIGTFLTNSKTCQTCPTNCTACTASACTDCKLTFQIIGTGCACDNSVQYFLSAAGDCKLISSSAMIPNCLAGVLNGTNPIGVGCLTCASGYYHNLNTDYCSLCPNTCITCTSDTSCTSCLDTYSLIGGLCKCDSSLQLFNSGSSCQLCYSFVDYCTECTDTGTGIVCGTCGSGTYKTTAASPLCIPCGANCDSCTATACTKCVPGFAQDAATGACTFTNQCQNFVGADPNCVFCSLSATSTTQCQACMVGYYVDSFISCVACPSTCVTCSDYFTCLTCQPTYTLISGACQCDPLSNQVLSGTTCVNCNFLEPNCQTCSSNVAPVTCSTCLPTFHDDGSGDCVLCPSGCLTCDINGVCLTCIPGAGPLPTCTPACATTAQYYNLTTSNCQLCPTFCTSCLNATQCLSCSLSYTLINGACQCDTAHGYFPSPLNNICNLCGSILSFSLGVKYPLNCSTCVASATDPAGFVCLVCQDGSFVSGGACQNCQAGCSQCSAFNSCYFCQAPIYTLSSGSCVCDKSNNYFLNGTICQQCVLANCGYCTSLTTCSFCISGYFVNSTSFLCQPEVCGNGRLEGIQQCDDSNNIDGDGCSSTCLFEAYWVCTNLIQGQLSKCEAQNNKFKLQVSQQTASCNKIAIKLKNIGQDSIAECTNISNLLTSYSLNYSSLQQSNIEGNYVTYTFSYNHSIEGQSFNFEIDPTILCVTNSDSFPPFSVSGIISPTNNRPAVYYKQGSCESQQSAKSFVSAMQYTSYAALAVSAVPCKIAGLQLMGVMQLAHLSLGSLNNINLMLEPLTSIGGVNGYRQNFGKDKTSRLLQTFTPQRINAIDYNANFIRNCNVMLLIVLAIIVVSFILYILTYCFKNCAPKFYKIAKRLIKEVLLTLILFNALNFAYSAGIHFGYAPIEDQLYSLGTMAAAGTLIIPILMAIALLCTEDEGFGEFKDKLKPGCVERSYFVVTIIYRVGVGLYMSSANESELSTLMLLAFSIMFLVYNLVNLPFTKAYHNYRANICHFAQFVTLFVAMFYRSMKSTTDLEESASIFTPVYFEYVFIFASVLVSVVVLGYEVYLFIKDCCAKKQESSHQVITKTEENSFVEHKDIPEIHQKTDHQVEVFESYQ